MAPDYLHFYRRYTWRAAVRFLVDAFRASRGLRRASLLNRYRDYLGLARCPELMVLHRRLGEHLVAATRAWGSYDYGEGYFYQSLPQIGVSGLRDTTARVEAMGLRQTLGGKRVLEIGCNTGFISLLIADVAAEVVGIDINPHLIEIARDVAAYLGIESLTFQVKGFEEFTPDQLFDSVLSFANHATYDGNTRQSIEQYFGRCADVLVPGGLLLFESHAPGYEGAGSQGVIDTIAQRFTLVEQRILDVGTFLDRGRTFVVARKN